MKYSAKYSLNLRATDSIGVIVETINSRNDELVMRRAAEIRRRLLFDSMGEARIELDSVRVGASGRYVYRRDRV